MRDGHHEWSERLRRIALLPSNTTGSAFCGWQRQTAQSSVQATLELALARLSILGAQLEISVAAIAPIAACIAAGQVRVHFDLVSGRFPAPRWPNAHSIGPLPPTRFEHPRRRRVGALQLALLC